MCPASGIVLSILKGEYFESLEMLDKIWQHLQKCQRFVTSV
jgi:hypothetical protein